nr:unnamed protein product [Digitaria exilis]
MNLERLPPPAGSRHGHYRYARMLPPASPDGEAPPEDPEPEPERRPEVLAASASASLRVPDAARVFDELPRAHIVAVSPPDAGDITPMLLSYTIEVHYKQVRDPSPPNYFYQFRWRLYKKASQVLYLHFALKRREFLEEFHEKQEQVKEWLQNLGIGEHMPVVHDEDEADDVNVPLQSDENSIRNRNVPSSAVLPVIRPAIGRQNSISDRAKVAMQEYLNHFLGNLDIVNSQEVCKFLEVSCLSFLPEYGPKLKEDYVSVGHLPKIQKDRKKTCCSCGLFNCCKSNWQKVWVVLKPGFLALLEDPFDRKLLDVIIFDALPHMDINGEGQISLAKEIKERNPLHFGFQVSSGGRTIKLRTRSSSKVKDWVTAINAARQPPEGWCYPHRFGSFAPPRGLLEDGSMVQWFIDGQAAFEAIASSIEEAKSEIYILLYKEVALALKINSLYSKQRLLNIHENVKVLRYPDHFSSGVYLWSHHEKIVIVDNQVCYIGGLDLCFGRYDSPEHKVADSPPIIWPGKDYYNPRESEPNSWEDTMKDELDRAKYPRMPWHDVQCALYGPPCRDVARHFVQRWNYAKRNKALNEQAIPLLMPHHHMVVRSVGQWSAGTSQIEGSIHNAYLTLIEKAEHFVYIENQFFISGLPGDDTIKNRVLDALYRRILRADREKKRFKAIIIIPLLPGFQGGIDDGGAASVRAIMHWQYRTICRGPNSILQNLFDVIGPKAHDYISFYGLRAHGKLHDGGPLVTSQDTILTKVPLQIYVHSKLMIIDDRITLIGSANINDRSLLGSRDSEIAVVIEDKEVVNSKMDGRPWEAGKFSLSLRLSLWAEHLGLHLGEVSHIMDPIDDSTFKNIWMATAKRNTMIYQDVFSCVPNDLIHSRAQFRQSFAQLRDKIGHTTIDLGVAQSTLETYQDGDLKGTDPMDRLRISL